MTESVIRHVDHGATHLIVVDALKTVVSVIDLSAEQPKGIYIPKGDSLYEVLDGVERVFLARPGIDQDMTVDLAYQAIVDVEVGGTTPAGFIVDEHLAIVDGSDYIGPVEVVEDKPKSPPPLEGSASPILRYFGYAHYQNEDLIPIAELCFNLAWDMERDLPNGPEKSAGLRKLLEAKDCFVRAALD